MRKTSIIFALFFMTGALFGQSVVIPKVSPNETPVLADGEIAVSVTQDGEPVQMRYGDGVAAGGRVLYDSRTTIKLSPIVTIPESQYQISLTGSAYWTNGVIEGFPPTTVYNANIKGTVTVSIASTSGYKLQSMLTSASMYFATHSPPVISADGLSASYIIGHAVEPPATTINHYYTLESITLLAYSNPDALGATQDMRGFEVLVGHPGSVPGAVYTNEASYRPITMGWYDGNVQTAVARFSEHPALSTLPLRAGMTLDDGVATAQRFRWAQRANGYLSLTHESDVTAPVLSIEAMDPYPWIVAAATGTVSTIEFTTNGVTGDFRLQTCTNLLVGTWVDAEILATNTAPAGYMSLTGSNTLGGTVAFFRVSVSNAVQEEARARFSIPVQAPRFELADGVYLFWSNSALMVQSGPTNGLVGVTW